MARRPNPLNELEKLERLYRKGMVSEDAYQSQKARWNAELEGIHTLKKSSGCGGCLTSIAKVFLACVLLFIALALAISFTDDNKKETKPVESNNTPAIKPTKKAEEEPVVPAVKPENNTKPKPTENKDLNEKRENIKDNLL